MHQDGDGYNVILQALPLDGKIVLRLPKQEAPEQARQPRRADNDKRRGDERRR
jgi:hypothetical protein